MSDAQRVQESVLLLICKYLPDLRFEHRLTLAQMVAGIIRSGKVQLRQIARKLAYPGKKSSLVNKFRRFLRNKHIDVEVNFLPFVELILDSFRDDEKIILSLDSALRLPLGDNQNRPFLHLFDASSLLPRTSFTTSLGGV